MNRRATIAALGAGLIGRTVAKLCGQTSEDAAVAVAKALEDIRARHRVPGLAAAAMIDGKMAALEAVGVRKSGDATAVTTGDRWHIGSCTKSMTATLAAMLVEDGKMAWDTKVVGAFPEWRDVMDPGWHEVSLEHLLAHRGGAPAEPPSNLWQNAWRASGPAIEQRLDFVRGLLMRRPVSAPGEKFSYSNQGYSIAGAMLERVAGRAWEDLMRERLFAPLEMTFAGFGAPGDPRKVDQPWGHRLADGESEPVPPGKEADNPAAIGPAGTVHCSIGDFVRYAAWHAQPVRTTARILGPASFTKLHTPPAGDYAMGWGVVQRKWAGGTALTHAGSNTLWFAVMWLAPARDAAFVAATNIAGRAAERACDDAVAMLIRRTLS